MLRMYVEPEQMNPSVSCSECTESASTLIFDAIQPTEPHVFRTVELLYGKCWDHLLFAEQTIPLFE